MSSESFRDIEPHSFYLETCGCAKNSVDSENLIALLSQNGLVHTTDADAADVLIVNTCGFIGDAKKESVAVFTDLRERYPDKKLAVTGCLAQRYENELKKTGAADLFIGNRSIRKTAEAVLRLAGTEVVVPDALFYERNFFFSTPRSVYVKIAEGCENFCSFCAIPLIRGRVKSRSEESIEAEVRALTASGVYEINLAAQDLTAFGSNGNTESGTAALERLLKRLDAIDGNFQIRLLYLHPDHITDSLLQTVASCKKVLPYFDIPFQHACAEILRRMGRKGDAAVYGRLIKKIRTLMPNAVIRSTFMAGFPGETKKRAAEVGAFLKENRLDWVGFFVYSREEGTAAARFRGALRHRLARRRAFQAKAEWEKIQAAVTAEKMKAAVGREEAVLIEEPFAGEPLAVGRTWFQAPEVDGCVVVKGGRPKMGDVWVCRIVGANGPDLEAEALRPWIV